MTSERMTMEDLKDFYIPINLREQAKTWLSNSTDHAVFVAQAHYEIPHSDLNAARQIKKTFDHLVHYVPGTGAWHIWNGVFHERIDGDLLAHWMCKTFVDEHKKALARVKEHYTTQAASLSGDQAKKKMAEYEKGKFAEHRSYRDKIHSNSGLQALVTQIKQEFSVPDSFFTEDRQWLVLENGVIDLEELRRNPPKPGDLASIRLLDHDPARPVWRSVKASLNPNAVSPRWLKFMSSSQPDPQLRKFLAVVTGAAFLAESKTKIIPVLKGPRDSGKTVFIDTMHKLAAGYGGQPDTAAINKSAQTNFEQDQFRGLRFVGVSEPNTDRKVDDSFLKKLTGGDIISTRNLHAKSQEWKSQCVLFVATNTQLRFNTSDAAILSRFATVTFPHRFYPEGHAPAGKEEYIMDKTLEHGLAAEMDGVLSWVLNGMLVYLDENIVIPDSVERERERQFIEGSTVISWIKDYVEQGKASFVIDTTTERAKSHYVALADAHLSYCSWCIQEIGDDPVTKKAFSTEMQNYLDTGLVKSGEYRIPGLVYSDMALV